MAIRRSLSMLLLLALCALVLPVPPVLAQQPGCWYDPQVAERLSRVQFDDWSGWVKALSGEVEVIVNGQPQRITTRYSPYLFDGTSAGYDYVLEQLRGWYPEDQIEQDPYEYGEGSKNLILNIPGTHSADEVVLLTAHLDSTSNDRLNAPGADDNASGSAVLLEAARVLRPENGKNYALPRTLRLIWFTSEEQGLRGSAFYAEDHNLENVLGVFNVDMIGYDGDGDRCFELHVGTLAASQPVGQCFVNALNIYDFDLRHEYLTTTATTRSDHSVFWNKGIGALQVSENFFSSYEPGSCGASDANPNYHAPQDTYANMHPQYAFEISRAVLAAAFSFASPQPAPHSIYFPLFQMLKND